MTEQELQEELQKYKTARDNILVGGQKYSVDGNNLERANLETIEKKIKELETRLALSKQNREGFAFGVSAVFGSR